jgi:hypothetical protein
VLGKLSLLRLNTSSSFTALNLKQAIGNIFNKKEEELIFSNSITVVILLALAECLDLYLC